MGKTNKKALLILICLILLSFLALFITKTKNFSHPMATIMVDSKIYKVIDLNQEKDRDISLFEETGKNIILRIKDHKICFLESDCPDKICIHEGYINKDTQTAICMPNKTSILITDEGA